MTLKKLVLCTVLLQGIYQSSSAQTVVPANLDFETGTTANWEYYRGTVASGHIYSLASSSAVAGLHTITSGSGTDPYGGFPVVGHGTHSLQLAHDTIDNNADAAAYNIHVPTGGSYTLDYYYAAVLQDAAHPFAQQPVLEVSAIDSATGTPVPSASLIISTSTTGLMTSTVDASVRYMPWTAGSIDLTGYGGHTVTLQFTVASCATGGHFGYGYVDVGGLTSSILTTPAVLTAGTGTINLFPNPTPGLLMIQWAGQQTGDAKVKVTDMTGRVVSTSSLNFNASSGEAPISLAGLNDGLYLVSVTSASVSYCGRVVIQH